jgi:hypothetical protein
LRRLSEGALEASAHPFAISEHVHLSQGTRWYGNHDLVDTEEMFLRMFSDFRRDRIIP